jgi:hypothetical protein
VRRVHAHFKGLQPVAVPQALEGKAVAGRARQNSPAAAGRAACCPRAQVGKQHAGGHLHRVAALAHPLAQGAARGSAGVSRHLAVAANFQPWKGQRMPSASCARKGQVGTAVRAVAVKQAPGAAASLNSTRSCPSRRTALSGRSAMRGSRRGVKFVQQRHRLPVAAHQRTAGRARADAGDEFVLRGLHGGGQSRVPPWHRASCGKHVVRPASAPQRRCSDTAHISTRPGCVDGGFGRQFQQLAAFLVDAGAACLLHFGRHHFLGQQQAA